MSDWGERAGGGVCAGFEVAAGVRVGGGDVGVEVAAGAGVGRGDVGVEVAPGAGVGRGDVGMEVAPGVRAGRLDAGGVAQAGSSRLDRHSTEETQETRLIVFSRHSSALWEIFLPLQYS
jgi:hypothetical protein